MRWQWVVMSALITLLAVSAATAQTTDQPAMGGSAGSKPAPQVHAVHPISVVINGAQQAYDTPPMIVQDRVMVPLRGVFESLGATVIWYPATQTVNAVASGNKAITLTVGSREATVDGRAVSLEVPAMLQQDRVYVPLRFVCAATGYDVTWEGADRRIAIATPGGTTLAKAPICAVRPTPVALAPMEPAPSPAPIAQVPEPAFSAPSVPLACGPACLPVQPSCGTACLPVQPTCGCG